MSTINQNTVKNYFCSSLQKEMQENKLILNGHLGAVYSLCVHKGELFSGSDDNTIRKWNTKGECIGVLEKHTNWVFCICIHDGFLYSGSGDHIILKWNDSGNPISVLL